MITIPENPFKEKKDSLPHPLCESITTRDLQAKYTSYSKGTYSCLSGDSHSTTPQSRFFLMTVRIAFILLNIFRIITILSLVLVSTVTILMISLQVGYFSRHFFSVVSECSRIGTCLILITTELPHDKVTRFYESRCRVLTDAYSLAWTGVPLLSIACSVLGDTRSVLLVGRLGSVTRSMMWASGTPLALMGLLYCAMPLIYWNAEAGTCRRARRLASQAGGGEPVEEGDGESRYSDGQSIFNHFTQKREGGPRAVEISAPLMTRARAGVF